MLGTATAFSHDSGEQFVWTTRSKVEFVCINLGAVSMNDLEDCLLEEPFAGSVARLKYGPKARGYLFRIYSHSNPSKSEESISAASRKRLAASA
jgi:hypothetical protein